MVEEGGMDGNGTLETQGQISTGISLATSQSLMRGSLGCCPCDPMEEADFHPPHSHHLPERLTRRREVSPLPKKTLDFSGRAGSQSRISAPKMWYCSCANAFLFQSSVTKRCRGSQQWSPISHVFLARILCSKINLDVCSYTFPKRGPQKRKEVTCPTPQPACAHLGLRLRKGLTSPFSSSFLSLPVSSFLCLRNSTLWACVYSLRSAWNSGRVSPGRVSGLVRGMQPIVTRVSEDCRGRLAGMFWPCSPHSGNVGGGGRRRRVP